MARLSHTSALDYMELSNRDFHRARNALFTVLAKEAEARKQ